MNEMKAPRRNMQYLRCFSAAAASGSISGAATVLGRSQPAVSKAIASLESQIGATLLDRGKTGVVATAAGAVLVDRCGEAFATLDTALKDIFGLDKVTRQRVLSSVTTSQIEALLAIARQGSMTRAAHALGIAPSSLHKSARQLETAINQEVFEQTSYGVGLKKNAKRFADAVGLVFSTIGQAFDEISALKGEGAGATVIGAMPLARAYLVPRAVTTCTKSYPAHRISIVEGVFDNLLQELLRGDIDFLVGAARGDAIPREIVEEYLFEDELAILMRANHPLSQVRNLTLKRLTKFPWIAPRRESPLWDRFQRLFDGETPSDIVECNAFSAARGILTLSDRLMLLSETQAQFELEMGVLVSKPLKNTKRTIVLTTRRSWRPTQIQSKLLDIVRNCAASS